MKMVNNGFYSCRLRLVNQHSDVKINVVQGCASLTGFSQPLTTFNHLGLTDLARFSACLRLFIPAKPTPLLMRRQPEREVPAKK